MEVTVLNMSTGEESCYLNLTPIEALISAAIMQARETSNLTNPLTRKRFSNKIIFSKITASIGDLGVKL